MGGVLERQRRKASLAEIRSPEVAPALHELQDLGERFRQHITRIDDPRRRPPPKDEGMNSAAPVRVRRGYPLQLPPVFHALGSELKGFASTRAATRNTIAYVPHFERQQRHEALARNSPA